ncbi:reverse transcriptase, putative [Ixodes scapularis]|uniref:Reverse transcriptase, putative n=1 Tax=Ixodes scapularis TaxID=6945 RepID=B7PXG0_IXOSC|nr:reverse transcriptase, putative [Ixodes scapularis]|eukprot:XP_002400472.1 reverse transcriptase, putative [Ixodes scapularis]
MELEELLERVKKAPLKPQQRLLVLRTYLLPRLFHRLILGPWSVGLLKKLDTKVRAALRSWLALPHDVPLGYFHAPVGEGGLGVVSLRASIPSMRLRRFEGLRFSDHPGCAEALRCPLLLKWSVLWEPHYSLPEGVLKPDLVAYKGEDSLIIDAQVVGTKMGLGFLHHQKKDKYSGVELRRLVQGERTGSLTVTTVTLNFRGVWSPESARDLQSLGLTGKDLKLLSVRCLQGGMRWLLGPSLYDHRGVMPVE